MSFFTKDNPVGQSAVVQHNIRTTGDPIKSQYRWIPEGLREEAIKEEDRMKKLTGGYRAIRVPFSYSSCPCEDEGWNAPSLY